MEKSLKDHSKLLFACLLLLGLVWLNLFLSIKAYWIWHYDLPEFLQGRFRNTNLAQIEIVCSLTIFLVAFFLYNRYYTKEKFLKISILIISLFCFLLGYVGQLIYNRYNVLMYALQHQEISFIVDEIDVDVLLLSSVILFLIYVSCNRLKIRWINLVLSSSLLCLTASVPLHLAIIQNKLPFCFSRFWVCKTKKAIEKKNPKLCSKNSACLAKIAFTMDDFSICDTARWPSHCYRDLAVATRDPILCHHFTINPLGCCRSVLGFPYGGIRWGSKELKLCQLSVEAIVAKDSSMVGLMETIDNPRELERYLDRKGKYAMHSYSDATILERLAVTGDSKSLKYFIKGLNHDSPIDIVIISLAAMGNLKHRKEIDRIISLIDHNRYEVRIAALTTLARIGGPRIAPVLLAELSRESEILPYGPRLALRLLTGEDHLYDVGQWTHTIEDSA